MDKIGKVVITVIAQRKERTLVDCLLKVFLLQPAIRHTRLEKLTKDSTIVTHIMNY